MQLVGEVLLEELGTDGAASVDHQPAHLLLGRVLHVLHLASGEVPLHGGHAEPSDESLAAAVLRELHEETRVEPEAAARWPGYEAVPIDIHDVDAHPGKGELGHVHFIGSFSGWAPRTRRR
ncbi:NUDIX domain-containing protein [Streptomyces sp. NPDC102282]|uniref:NUDIX domain-containing protein n=1 Tax=Streptomyces sp. NPDC102282 TaxID=3366154 RepID=UPI00382FE642